MEGFLHLHRSQTCPQSLRETRIRSTFIPEGMAFSRSVGTVHTRWLSVNCSQVCVGGDGVRGGVLLGVNRKQDQRRAQPHR